MPNDTITSQDERHPEGCDCGGFDRNASHNADAYVGYCEQTGFTTDPKSDTVACPYCRGEGSVTFVQFTKDRRKWCVRCKRRPKHATKGGGSLYCDDCLLEKYGQRAEGCVELGCSVSA